MDGRKFIPVALSLLLFASCVLASTYTYSSGQVRIINSEIKLTLPGRIVIVPNNTDSLRLKVAYHLEDCARSWNYYTRMSLNVYGESTPWSAQGFTTKLALLSKHYKVPHIWNKYKHKGAVTTSALPLKAPLVRFKIVLEGKSNSKLKRASEILLVIKRPRRGPLALAYTLASCREAGALFASFEATMQQFQGAHVDKNALQRLMKRLGSDMCGYLEFSNFLVARTAPEWGKAIAQQAIQSALDALYPGLGSVTLGYSFYQNTLKLIDDVMKGTNAMMADALYCKGMTAARGELAFSGTRLANERLVKALEAYGYGAETNPSALKQAIKGARTALAEGPGRSTLAASLRFAQSTFDSTVEQWKFGIGAGASTTNARRARKRARQLFEIPWRALGMEYSALLALEQEL